ncbi:MAG: hypothetical protein NZ922_04910 [Candidatus Methanomethyliaceae archaeon]|nr:hypothetical protein [Candidatus Methanomethyliaceae archaeon]MCX8169790.1 hypothetical protein [Candidatus Methanomethyliaceae archaeon]MDW7971372.1 hypothetical protein [Nitrososphaerota archaeon]
MSSEVKAAIGDLIKVLNILRRTSPFHNLGEEERKEVIKALEDVMERIRKLREGMEK